MTRFRDGANLMAAYPHSPPERRDLEATDAGKSVQNRQTTVYFRQITPGNEGAYAESVQTPSASLPEGLAFLRYFGNIAAMDIWTIKHRAMWRARLCAIHVMLVSAMLIWCLAMGAFVVTSLAVASVTMTGWTGIKFYRLAVAMI
jgi:hypothetical protein